MKDLINRCVNAIMVGADIASIYSMLKEEGLTDYQAWLTYQAAVMVTKE